MPAAHLRWGLLSTARINKSLIVPLHMSKRNQVVAVASRVQEKADMYARLNKIKNAYGSYAALLDDSEVDVIYNSLPNNLHAEWTIRSVQAGKHVLCEKPLALTLSEVDDISTAAKKYGKVVAEAFMYRSHPQTLKVRELVEKGKLGKVKIVRGTFSFMMDNPDDYRWKPEMGGGGLWDVGCYPLSYTRFVLGLEPVEVFGWQVTGSTGVDECFIAQMQFPGEIYAQFDCSVKLPYHVFMEIVGDEATLVIPNPFNPGGKEKLFLSQGGKLETINLNAAESYLCEVEDMADSILLGKQTRVTLEDSRMNTAAILALFESAKIGRPVSVKTSV